jgi:hypothetical protein
MLTELQTADAVDRIDTSTGYVTVIGIFGRNIAVTNHTICLALPSILYIVECQQKNDYNSKIVIL